MKYPLLSELPDLVSRKMISARRHATLPLTIYNYTVASQMTPLTQWTEAMKDCRGLILDDDGEVIGRPFRKFWNASQYQEIGLPTGEFNVWEKVDGSLGILCGYRGELVCATRGSFESDQAKWFRDWIWRKHGDLTPSGETYLLEIVYPGNRIVVDYGKREEAVLLSVMSPDGVDLWNLFDSTTRFTKARRFDGISDFSTINSDPRFAGEEGFVLQWPDGFRAKCKLEEYVRIHRLITSCSTRTIWELLRTGAGIQELVARVPVEFEDWVALTAGGLNADFERVSMAAMAAFNRAQFDSRKDFAMWAVKQDNPMLLFALLDGKDIGAATWKLVEPKWATPFRKDIDA